MKLIVNGENNQKQVDITTKVDMDGDVVVMANGVDVLWIFNDGCIHLNTTYTDVTRLEGMGFQLSTGKGVLVK